MITEDSDFEDDFELERPTTPDAFREAFVRTRFAEPQFFARQDIELWIRQPHEPKAIGYDIIPWFVPPLYEAFAVQWEKRGYAKALEEFATPLRDVPSSMFRDRMQAHEARRHLGYFLQQPGIELFQPAILIEPPERGPRDLVVMLGASVMIARCTFGAATFMSACDITAERMVGVLVNELLSGGPRADGARYTLLKAYHAALAHVREEAEREFASAVAVYPNGRKIIHADWVVLASDDDRGSAAPDGEFKIIEPDRFLERKIIFHSERVIRERVNASATVPGTDADRLVDAKKIPHERIRVIAGRLEKLYGGSFRHACFVEVKARNGSRSKILIVPRGICPPDI